MADEISVTPTPTATADTSGSTASEVRAASVASTDVRSGRLVLDADAEYLDLRASQESIEGASVLSREQAEQYRDAFLKTNQERLDDQAELQSKRKKLAAIQKKINGLDAQLGALQTPFTTQSFDQKYWLYGAAGMLGVGLLGWLLGRKSRLAAPVSDAPSAFHDYVAQKEQEVDEGVSQVAVEPPVDLAVGVEDDQALAQETMETIQAEKPLWTSEVDVEHEAVESRNEVDADSAGLPNWWQDEGDEDHLNHDDERIAALSETNEEMPESLDEKLAASQANSELVGANAEEDASRVIAEAERNLEAAHQAFKASEQAEITDGLTSDEVDVRLSELVNLPQTDLKEVPVVPSAAAPLAVDFADSSKVSLPDSGLGKLEDEAIQDGMTPEQIEDRLSRLAELPPVEKTVGIASVAEQAATAKNAGEHIELSPADVPVQIEADSLPDPVQQQIRVEQLLRNLSQRQQEFSDSDKAALAAMSPEEPVHKIEKVEDVQSQQVATTSVSEQTDAEDNILMQSAFADLDDKQQSAPLHSEASVEVGSAGLDLYLGEDEPEPTTMTAYEEIVELAESNTQFHYEGSDYAAETGWTNEAFVENGLDAVDEYTVEMTEESVQLDAEVAEVVAEKLDTTVTDDVSSVNAAAFTKPVPWYKKLFSKKATQNKASQIVAASALGASVEADYVENTEALGTEQRLDSIWEDSKDWLPESSGAEENFTPNLDGEMRQLPVALDEDFAIRPQVGESMLGFLRRLNRHVSGLLQAGEWQTARELLLKHIVSMPDTSPWAYLEFLSLSEPSSEDALLVSAKFKDKFDRIPPLGMSSQGAGMRSKLLLDYPQATNALSELWPKEQTRDILDRWLAGYESNMRLFSLATYRELFVLYDILDDVLDG